METEVSRAILLQSTLKILPNLVTRLVLKSGAWERNTTVVYPFKSGAYEYIPYVQYLVLSDKARAFMELENSELFL